LLLLFTFGSQFKPSEPFLVDYLVQRKGLTNQQVYGSIFPIYVYARLPCTALVGVAAELPGCGNTIVLALGAAASLLTSLLTRFAASLVAQQASQVFIALAFSSRYALFAVVFKLTMPAEQQTTVHNVRVAELLSNCLSALLGELLRDGQVPLPTVFSFDVVSQALTLLFAGLLHVHGTASSNSPSAIPRSRSMERPVLLEHRQQQQQQHARQCLQLAPTWRRGDDVREPGLSAAQANRRRSIHTLACRWLVLSKPTLTDMLFSFRIRSVAWWTVWALAMSTSHGIALTYWQALLREKNITRNHNGYLLATMYFLSAALTAVSGWWTFLRSNHSVLIIGSLLVAGGMLCMLALASTELTFYFWLLLFQCCFEVLTAVATFQVGRAVTEAFGGDREPCGSTSSFDQQLSAHEGTRTTGAGAWSGLPQGRARLTLVLSLTGILSGAAGIISQAVMGTWIHLLSGRFWAVGLGLQALAGVMLCVGIIELCFFSQTIRDARSRGDAGRTADGGSAEPATLRPSHAWNNAAA